MTLTKQTKKTNKRNHTKFLIENESAAEMVMGYCHFANEYIDILTFMQPFKRALQRAAGLEMSRLVLKEENLYQE